VSALGGIAASIKLFTGVITTVLILSYIISLAQVYHRKYQYKYQKSEMYKMMEYFETLMVKQNKENFSPGDLKKMVNILAEYKDTLESDNYEETECKYKETKHLHKKLKASDAYECK